MSAFPANVPDESFGECVCLYQWHCGFWTFRLSSLMFDNPPALMHTPLAPNESLATAITAEIRTDAMAALAADPARLNVIAWADETKARELKSACRSVGCRNRWRTQAIEQPGVVINMPFVVWDGGKR